MKFLSFLLLRTYHPSQLESNGQSMFPLFEADPAIDIASRQKKLPSLLGNGSFEISAIFLTYMFFVILILDSVICHCTQIEFLSYFVQKVCIEDLTWQS
jgi:hypothetical protein